MSDDCRFGDDGMRWNGIMGCLPACGRMPRMCPRLPCNGPSPFSPRFRSGPGWPLPPSLTFLSSPLISSPLPSSHASVALCARSVSAAPLGLGVANNAVPRYSAICSYAARWTFWCSVPHPTPGICISGSAPFTFERRPDRILPLATRFARWFHFKRAKS